MWQIGILKIRLIMSSFLAKIYNAFNQLNANERIVISFGNQNFSIELF
jgi:hypothetical protein